MSQQLIDVGSQPNDKNSDTGRDAFIKVNENTTDLYNIKSQYKYTPVTTATRLISDAELFAGTNIFGVNYPGAVTITLPYGIDSNKIIVINDESGAAGTNNITIQVA